MYIFPDQIRKPPSEMCTYLPFEQARILLERSLRSAGKRYISHLQNYSHEI